MNETRLTAADIEFVQMCQKRNSMTPEEVQKLIDAIILEETWRTAGKLK